MTGYSANDSNGEKVNGTMPNKGAVTASLNCGGSYTIPKGYHNGSGKVTANSLSSQTGANATAKDIIKGKTAWVNGSKITGTATIESFGGINCKKITNCNSTVFLNGTGYYHYLDLSDLSFEPNFIIYNYGSSDSNSHYCNMLMLFDNTWTQLYHAGISGSVTKYYSRIYKIGATYGNTITISAKKIPVTVGNISASTPISLGTVYALKL